MIIHELEGATPLDPDELAGSFRKTEKNIGVDPLQISQQLRNLLDDAVAWHRYQTYPPRQALLRLHHGIVKIHPFANGNGRFARIYTDWVADKLYGIAPIQWGNADLQRTSAIRGAYIAALRAADGNDFSPLFELFQA